MAFKKFLLLLLVFFGTYQVNACSMCKITLDGKTFVGNNEDMWSHEAKLWFETGKEDSYGAVYFGHKNNSSQGGMNEAGLVFDAFSLHPNQRPGKTGKKQFENPSKLFESILQKCASAQEAKDFLEPYNLNFFTSGMSWIIDKKGDYLIIESDTLILGNDPNYVLVNFRPSETKTPEEIKIPRYHKGLAMLNGSVEASFEFCASVMDTMKACRGDLGDGTLYSNVYDIDKGEIYLYFYHDFSTFVKFNLKEELMKGNHTITIPELFPENKEYVNYLNYKTPFNSRFVFWILSFSGIFIAIVSLYYFFSLVWKAIKERKSFLKNSSNHLFGFILLANFFFLFLLPILLMIQPIYYFGIEDSLSGSPFPFTQQLIYFPILTTFFTLALLFFSYKIIKTISWSKIAKVMLSLNLIILLINLGLYAYWDILIV